MERGAIGELVGGVAAARDGRGVIMDLTQLTNLGEFIGGVAMR